MTGASWKPSSGVQGPEGPLTPRERVFHGACLRIPGNLYIRQVMTVTKINWVNRKPAFLGFWQI